MARERGEQESIRSKAGGQFEIAWKNGPARRILLVTAEGFAPHLEEIGAAAHLEVALEKGHELAIQLVEESRKGAENAEATLVPLALCGPIVEVLADALVWHAHADSDGRIVFRNVPGGSYALRISGKGLMVSSVAPLVVRKGSTEFRIRIPWGRSLRGTVDYPSPTARSSGSVVAFWKDPEVGPQWAEAAFSGDEGNFELNGVPFEEPVQLLARTDSGLFSGIMPLQELGDAGDSLKTPIPLRFPATRGGRLGEGVAASSLVVQFFFPSLPPVWDLPEAIAVPVGADRHFLIPGIPPLAEGLRLIAPGYGQAEARLKESASGDLGLVNLQPGPTLQGRVTWDDQSPLEGVEVEALAASGTLCRARTSRTGEFACSPRKEIPRDLRYRALAGEVVFPLTPLPGKSVPTLIAAPGNPIQINVSRPDGRGRVEDLRLEIESGSTAGEKSPPRRPRSLYARSPGGTLSLHVAESGPIQLTLSNPEGVPQSSIRVDPSSQAAKGKIAWTLSKGPVVFGTVAAATTGKVIEGAEVEVGSGVQDSERARLFRVTHTATDGSWRHEGIHEGTYQLAASAIGYSSVRKRVSVPGDSGTPQRLLLQNPGRIHGKVFGLPEGSAPSVTANPRTSWMDWTDYRSDLSSSGEFTIEAVRPDRYLLSLLVKKPVSRKDFQPLTRRYLSVEVRPGETTEAEMDLRTGVRVAGGTSLGAKPAANAELIFARVSKKRRLLSFDKTSTDDQGHYKVDLPGPGSYSVMLLLGKPDHDDAWIGLDRFLEIGEQLDQAQDLHFSNGQIRGRLVDSAAKPLSGASVEFERTILRDQSEEETRPGAKWSTESHEDGTFQFQPLAAGEYRLEVVAKGFATRETAPFSLGHDQEVDLQDVVLDPEMSLGILALDPRGAPLDQAYVTAHGHSSLNSGMGMASVKTGENGMANLKGLSPGSYTLVGTFAGLPPAFLENVKVPLKEPETSLVLQFVPGGSLDVQLLGRNGEPVADVAPQLIDSQGRNVTGIYSLVAYLSQGNWFTDTEGRARLDTVLPGEYLVKAGAGGKSDGRRVTVAAGQTTTVVLVAEEEKGE